MSVLDAEAGVENRDDVYWRSRLAFERRCSEDRVIVGDEASSR